MAKLILAVALVLALSVASASAHNKCDGNKEASKILSVLNGRGCYTCFLKYANASGLLQSLPNLITKHKLTLLIPNDAAFAKLSQSALNKLAKKPKYLGQILQLHALRGLWNADGLCKKSQGYAFTTLACYMSAITSKYNSKGASPVEYCAFGGSPANEDTQAKDMYCSSCVSVQGLADVIVPGKSFAKTCNYPGM